MDDRPWFKNWPKELPTSLEYPKVPLYKFLESSAIKHADRKAIIFQVGEKVTTYGELYKNARRFAAALQRLGVQKGDRVAVQMINTPLTAAAYYGILMAGAVYCPCNPLLSFRELLWQLNDTGAETFIMFEVFMDKFAPIRYDTPVKRLIVSGVSELMPDPVPTDVSQYGRNSYSLLRLITETPDDLAEVNIEPEDDLAHIAYTGGTTGVPKGVMITHYNAVVANLQQAHWGIGGQPIVKDGLIEPMGLVETDDGDDWDYPSRVSSQTWLVIVPWSHAMGVNGYLNIPVYKADTMIVHPRLDLPAYMNDLVKYKCTGCGGAPQLLIAMLNYPELDSLDLSHIRTIGCGAAPLPVEVYQGLQRKLPRAVIVEGYGLTEMTLGATCNPTNRSGLRKYGSVGIPSFDTDLKIVDLDDPDVEIGIGEIGEVCLRGPQMMKGYWKNPAETEKVIRNGWLLTGDLGYVDEDGYLFLVDRKKDMILYNGHNVYPRELEELLHTHRAVQDCAVIGKPHSLTGEIPKAFVVRRRDVKVTEQELIDFINIRVAEYKKIRELEFIDELPRNYAGKVLRRELRRWELERMERGETAPETKEELGL